SQAPGPQDRRGPGRGRAGPRAPANVFQGGARQGGGRARNRKETLRQARGPEEESPDARDRQGPQVQEGMKTGPKTVAVRVPASTSNCGAGFDTLGLALNL